MGEQICYKLSRCKNSYKFVTTFYKGVIVISMKVKAISVVLAVAFLFTGAAYANAAEPNASDSKADISASQPIKSVLEKSGFELKAEKVTEHSAVLKWNTDKSYIAYKVCKLNILTNEWEDYAQTTKNSIKIKKLSAGAEYNFCVLNNVTNELLGAVKVKTLIKKPKLKVKERTSKKIVLSLGKHAKNETVVIYRKTAGKKYKKIASVKGKSTYTDTKVSDSTAYSYKAKLKVKNGKKSTTSRYSSPLKTKTLLKMGLPAVSGSIKTYAYYTAVTVRSSPQYRLLNSSECYTDPETGIRMVDGCYCVALGSYYGSTIGTKYRVTFSTGTSINVILCDQKANCHTDANNQYALVHKDIMEFYVQASAMPASVRMGGDFGRYPKFSGSVVSIEKYV